MIAIVEASRAGLLKPGNWPRNLVAGLIVGVVALPLAMAFAIASGVKPEQGLYTAITAGLCVSLFGGSRAQIAGPTGAFIVILAGINAKYGIDGLLLATLMAGVMLILLGIARFGTVIRFIPAPVIVGFTAGIGVIIWVGQWHDFFGLPNVSGLRFHEKLWHLLQALPQLHWPTTVLALLSLAATIYGPRLTGLKRMPGPLLAILAATGIQWLCSFDGVATLGSAFGGIPRGLPHLAVPPISFDRIELLLPVAFTIAMLCAIESLLSAAVADSIAGTRHDPNQELIGQGIANLVGPLFGGIAATGAIARTATSLRNGANSPLAGIAHSITLLLILLILAPLAAHIPLCALAAILFVVAWNMSEVRRFLKMVHTAPRADVAILLVTFALTVLVDLVVAVNIGVILALLQFLRRMSESVQVRPLESRQLAAELRAGGIPDLQDGIRVYSIEGPLFFGAVEQLEGIPPNEEKGPHTLIVRLNHVPFMDITGIEALAESVRALERRGVRAILCEANQRVLRKLVRAGLVSREESPKRYFGELGQALADCEQPRAVAE